MGLARDSRDGGDSGVIFLRGMEVTTDMGHVGAFGLERYVGGIYKLAELRRVIDLEGGILIANHPFATTRPALFVYQPGL